MKKLYLAGGWFDEAQAEEQERIYQLLKDKFDVFNPKIAGQIETSTSHYDMSRILIGNIEHIKSADIVVVIYDRKDTGTIWESGFAYANQKPIIYYAETLGDKPFNLMLAKTGSFSKNEQELLDKLNNDYIYEFKDVYEDFGGNIE